MIFVFCKKKKFSYIWFELLFYQRNTAKQ